MAYEADYLRSWTRGWGHVIQDFYYTTVDRLDGDLEDEISDGEIGIVKYVDSDDELPDLLYAATDTYLIWSWEIEEDTGIGTGAISYSSYEINALRDRFSGFRSQSPGAETLGEDEEFYSLPGTGGPGTGLSTAANTVGSLITSAYDALTLQAQSTEITAVEDFRVASIPSSYFGGISTISGSSLVETIATPISATQETV